MANCILCGKEVERGGYSAKVKGVVIRPVCPDCDELCSKDPSKIVEEHREVFEKMLADHREAVAPRIASVATPEAPQRSPRERKLVRRYGDAYLRANTIVTIGNTIKVIGLVLAALIVLITVLFTIGQSKTSDEMTLAFGGAFVAGIIGMVCYALGILVAAQGQMLQAHLDTAVNSSPFLRDDLKAEVMSLPSDTTELPPEKIDFIHCQKCGTTLYPHETKCPQCKSPVSKIA